MKRAMPRQLPTKLPFSKNSKGPILTSAMSTNFQIDLSVTPLGISKRGRKPSLESGTIWIRSTKILFLSRRPGSSRKSDGHLLTFDSILLLMNQSRPPLATAYEERFSAAAKLFKEKEYSRSQTSFQDLISDIESKLQNTESQNHLSIFKKMASQCYLNKALCLLGLEEKDENEREVIKSLQKSVEMNNLNYWGYFNLFSLYHQNFNYHLALDNIKCSLSCLYLVKAVLSKDLQSKNREKDLGKAIGLCPNNLQAQFIRLIMHINQNRWRNALNQIGIIEELIGENQLLADLQVALNPKNISQGQQKQVQQAAIKTVLILQRSIRQSRLVVSPEEENPQRLVKIISEKVYEFNELLAQTNELGHVFGVFHYQSIAGHESSSKNIIVMSNLISGGFFKEELAGSDPRADIPQPKEGESRIQEPSNEFKNNESLFDYTKSNNEYIQSSKREHIENSKRQAEISGNLLSSLQGPKRQPLEGISEQSHEPELTNSGAFNLESIFLANMRKKEFNIRSIESQIRPLDPQEEGFYHTLSPNNNHFYSNNDDDDLLLDSAFDRSFAGKSNLVKKDSKKESRIMKKQSLEYLGDSKRSKLQKSKTEQIKRIYPLVDKYKYLQLHLNDFEFKDPSQQKVAQIYAEFEIKSHIGKNQKFSSKRQNSRLVGAKQKIDWDQSLGYIQLPQEPESLQIRIMKTERDKFFDSCLGNGQIEMTFAGTNKFPIYNGAKLVGMASGKLILSEEPLTSSFKQSSLSSSHKTESQNSIQ